MKKIEVGDIAEIKTGLYSSFKYFVEKEDNLLLLEEKVKQFWNIKTILTKEPVSYTHLTLPTNSLV